MQAGNSRAELGAARNMVNEVRSLLGLQ